MKTKIMAVTELPASFKRDIQALQELSDDQWNVTRQWLNSHLNVFDT